MSCMTRCLVKVWSAWMADAFLTNGSFKSTMRSTSASSKVIVGIKTLVKERNDEAADSTIMGSLWTPTRTLTKRKMMKSYLMKTKKRTTWWCRLQVRKIYSMKISEMIKFTIIVEIRHRSRSKATKLISIKWSRTRKTMENSLSFEESLT